MWQDILFKDILLPAIKLASSTCVSFPSKSQGRRVLLYKILDVLCFISLRIGFEHTREHMTHVLQKFFAAFSKAYTGDGKREEKSILSPVNSNTSKNLQLPVMMPSSELNGKAIKVLLVKIILLSDFYKTYLSKCNLSLASFIQLF